MIFSQIYDWNTKVVLLRVIRAILKSHLPEKEAEECLENEIEIEFNDGNQIPINIKIWMENNGRKYLQVYEVPSKFRKTISEIKDDMSEEYREIRRKTPIKDKVEPIFETIVLTDNKSGYIYFEGMLKDYEDDPDLPVIKEKLDNIIKLLNEGKIENVVLDDNEEFVIMDLDEIWDMI